MKPDCAGKSIGRRFNILEPLAWVRILGKLEKMVTPLFLRFGTRQVEHYGTENP